MTAVGILLGGAALAQTNAGQGAGTGTGIRNSDAQLRADEIKEQTYRSRSVGAQQNWNLDVGQFDAPPLPEASDIGELHDYPITGYSGLRLRMPLGQSNGR